MSVRIYWLHKHPNGVKIGIMTRPRGNEWLEDEIMNMKHQGVQVVVSLLERHEIYEISLHAQGELCAAHDIAYLNFPIPDRGIPKSIAEADRFIGQLIQKMQTGNTIVIHCRMGIGKSSIIAGRILRHLGYKVNEVIPHIGKMRGLSVPDTEEQVR